MTSFNSFKVLSTNTVTLQVRVLIYEFGEIYLLYYAPHEQKRQALNLTIYSEYKNFVFLFLESKYCLPSFLLSFLPAPLILSFCGLRDCYSMNICGKTK